MALDLPHHGQAVDGVGTFGAVDAAQILDLLFFQPLLFHRGVFFVLLCHKPLLLCFFQGSQRVK